MDVLADTNIAFDNDNGYGDYTEQREELLQGITLEDIEHEHVRNKKNPPDWAGELHDSRPYT